MTLATKILVPTDFSETAERAVEYAFELAEQLKASVYLVHAYDLPLFPDGTGLGPDVLAMIADAAEQALQRELDKYRAHKVFAGGRTEMGDPKAVIPRVARELPADLVIMGSHGRRGFRRLLLGSVAAAVVCEAPCAVLVVRAPPPASDGTGT
jgi:nucleotide-binding universal stress UspA family protein